MTVVEYKPDTSAVEAANRDIENTRLTIPVYYKTMNSPPSGSSASSSSAAASSPAAMAMGASAATVASGGAQTPVTQASSAPLSTVNLNIGGTSFALMSDKEVADALTRFINEQGGL